MLANDIAPEQTLSTILDRNKKLMQIVSDDYKTYSGRVLEEYFLSCMTESEEYTRLGYWEDRNGKNEIDIIGAEKHKIDDNRLLLCGVEKFCTVLFLHIILYKA